MTKPQKVTESQKKATAGHLPERYRGRLDGLFFELEQLACSSEQVSAEMHQEMEAIRLRLAELKKGIPELTPTDKNISSLPVNVQPSLNIQPIENGPLSLSPAIALTPDQQEIVQDVARQVSEQIQSLKLLEETEQARAEAEAASRRFIHQGWESYMDAIHQNERVGFSFDQTAVQPFIEPIREETGLREEVNIMGEQVGRIFLAPNPERLIGETDKEMVASIASQIAQQVENIRLLADAARARSEADEVIRRITREGWDAFTDRKEPEALSFAYDANRVTPYLEPLPETADLVLPLLVRGERIGQLAISGGQGLPPERAELAASIAEQASLHLETLRLNEELQRRAAELLELDRLKSGFLANMSHELRTPLNSILGFADVVLEGLDGPLTQNMSTDIRLIQKNGQHLLHLINDVLDMAKISAGRMNLNPEKVIVHDVIEEVVSITSTLASERHLSLFIEPDSDMFLEITADRTRLRQVMINLINNSIKFTEKGKISVRVDKIDNEYALIRVKDTGIGIPPEKLEVIFQEFTQVDTSSTRKVGGTGLGLPISRRLVTMHGGSLWVESTGISGEGSAFYVKMPLVARIADVIEKTER